MSLVRRLVRLDQRLLPSLRQEGETAEQYLRRTAGMLQRRHNDLGRALAEHFAQLDAERAERDGGGT